MNTQTSRYSATLSGQSALDGDECDVMSEMPNEDLYPAVLPQIQSIYFSSYPSFCHYATTNAIRPPHTVY